MVDLRQGDCVELMKEMEDNSVDLILTDPPYELGFMGRDWDKQGIAFDKTMWEEALRVLKPGGYLMAFSGSRTYHRMAAAIEDSGFEIRNMCAWLYGSGFPKGLDISKAIDKKLGFERKVVATQVRYNVPSGIVNVGQGERYLTERKITKPTSLVAKDYDGYRSQLKPAIEPIVYARKKFNFVLNIDIINEINILLEVISECARLYAKGVEKQLKQHLIEKTEGKNTVQENAEKVSKEKQSEKMGTCKLQEMGKTFWNIGLLWKSISEELLIKGNIYTTKTETSLTTELKTLKYNLLGDILGTIMHQQEIVENGVYTDVMNVEKLSREEKGKLISTLNVFVEESAMKQIGEKNLKRLVSFVEKNSIQMTLKGDSVQQFATINHTREEIKKEPLEYVKDVEKNLKQYHHTRQDIANGSATKGTNIEPIVIAQKGFKGTITDNVLKYGTGAFNIDKCRVGTETIKVKGGDKNTEKFFCGGFEEVNLENTGRYPSNVMLSEEIAPIIDKQSGYSYSRPNSVKGKYKDNEEGATNFHRGADTNYNDEGGASRFFLNVKLDEEDYIPFLYNAKCSRKERGDGNNHPTLKPKALLKHLAMLGLPPYDSVVLDMFSGSGSTALAIEEINKENGTNHKCILMEKEEEYCEIIKKRLGLNE